MKGGGLFGQRRGGRRHGNALRAADHALTAGDARQRRWARLFRELCVSQAEFARMVGVTNGMVTYWVQGKRGAYGESRDRIAGALGIERGVVDKLFVAPKKNGPVIRAKQGPRLSVRGGITALRLSRGWTQAELARRVGVDKAHISMIENGKANPSITLISVLAQAFDLRPVDVFAAFVGGTVAEICAARTKVAEVQEVSQ